MKLAEPVLPRPAEKVAMGALRSDLLGSLRARLEHRVVQILADPVLAVCMERRQDAKEELHCGGAAAAAGLVRWPTVGMLYTVAEGGLLEVVSAEYPCMVEMVGLTLLWVRRLAVEEDHLLLEPAGKFGFGLFVRG